MRLVVPLAILSLLGGCSLWMPSPDPTQAWVDLDRDAVAAAEVDSRPLDDDRFFQISPGTHELEMLYRFEVDASNIGFDAEPLERHCRLTLRYDDFDAGARYRVETGRVGFRPWARLYDARGGLLAHGHESGCGEV